MAELALTRRNFVRAAAATAVATGIAVEDAPAVASEAAAPADDALECDVVVVGLGASGLFAACGAANAGARVVAVDAAASMDGTTNTRTSAPWVCGSSLQAEGPEPLTVQECMDYVNNGTNYQSNQKALRATIGAGGRAVQMLIDAGMPFNVDFAATDSSTPMMQRGGHLYGVAGEERAAYFTKVADEAGVECLFSTTAEELLLDEAGEVAGVCCTTPDGTLDIAAKAVCLCSGGFLGSEEEVAKYFSGAEIVCMGNPLCTGNGINMALSAGAQVGKCFSISMNEYGGANKKASPTYSFRPNMGTNEAMRLPVFGGLLVDSMGDRFVNEGVMCEKTMFCAEPLIRDSYHYALCDEDYLAMWESTSLDNLMGDARMKGMFAGVMAEDLRGQFDQGIAEGWAFKADTLAEVAEHFGLPNLEATVAAYNELCEKGADDEFFKDARYLTPVKNGPFYIVQSMPAGWLSLGGIKCNAAMQALDAQNKTIPHLFVAGADADIFTSPYYAAGSANGFALGSGLVAGEAAAADALA